MTDSMGAGRHERETASREQEREMRSITGLTQQERKRKNNAVVYRLFRYLYNPAHKTLKPRLVPAASLQDHNL